MSNSRVVDIAGKRFLRFVIGTDTRLIALNAIVAVECPRDDKKNVHIAVNQNGYGYGFSIAREEWDELMTYWSEEALHQ